jgi:hypothetical protein
MRRFSLPVVDDEVLPDALDMVEIAIPCQVPWDSMPGDEQVRHCGQCKQNVYNVSSLTRAEAMRLVGARACLRIYRRPDNTVITSDCRERLRAARKKGLLVFAGTLLIVLWAQISAQFVGMMGLKRLLGGGPTMGEPAPVPGQIVAPPPPVMGEPPPIIPMMGAPPPLPKMGEAAPVPAKPPRRPTHGKPPERTMEKMGKIVLPRGLDG